MHEEELDDDPLTALSSPQMPEDYRERSVHLYADPKLRELKHYTRSHQHERRLRVSAGFVPRPKPSAAPGEKASAQVLSSLRREGCGVVDWHMKRLAHSQALPMHSKLPQVGNSRLPPEQFVPQEGSAPDVKQEDSKSVQTRLHWRAHMDNAVKSLLVDLELARDARLKEYSHQARCDHLDKIYDWYLMHGMKEVRKERETPPHIRYNPDSSVMPGSMRITPKGIERSESSPALVNAGSWGIDSASKARRPSGASNAVG